ncbi:MAG: RlmE family RNA methyltransferase [Betaproteobacteria bacterium]|jgi:23S rRNA (uridine2552-2'-O)-methyltransferase|nr:MAG: RlmE family RNA methyltransferase [Betaproteobacteria bacterium]
MAGKKTSRAWMREHVSDPFVKLATRQGLRSRAVFKLEEINARDKLISAGMCVVDLGAAPGGWSQLAAPLVGAGGKVVALDILNMEAIPNVDFIRGDFSEDAVLKRLEQALDGRAVDLVLSDMAPNMSGVRSTDQARWAHLSELAVEFARTHLNPGGTLLVKCFQGAGADDLRREIGALFDSVVVRKPKASRDRSREFFLLAKGLTDEARQRAQPGETV